LKAKNPVIKDDFVFLASSFSKMEKGNSPSSSKKYREFLKHCL
jgi:hypothetical protein